jgi:hypothetical protein
MEIFLLVICIWCMVWCAVLRSRLIDTRVMIFNLEKALKEHGIKPAQGKTWAGERPVSWWE